ncbi:MAG TPA: alpha/beta hydrolase [Solirubrobacteraceae bacterium]|nr:alpha/beta hydrolase [Solirubrobacteraceae bacterium]
MFCLHGTPGSRLTRHPDEGVYREAGVRAITYDRPGYGASSRHAGRRVADAAHDVAVIADALRVNRFAVVGVSGGAAHALACGALAPDRVTRCASVVGPAPLGPGGLSREEFFAGMVEGNIREFGWALAGEGTLRPELEREARELITSLHRDSGSPLGADYTLSEADLEVMRGGDVRAMLAASVREGIGRTVDGLVDDDLAFTVPWGFDVARITVPVSVYYGPHDTLVPAGHGEWLARTIPGARVSVLDGGHFASYERMPEILAWLTNPALT